MCLKMVRTDSSVEVGKIPFPVLGQALEALQAHPPPGRWRSALMLGLLLLVLLPVWPVLLLLASLIMQLGMLLGARPKIPPGLKGALMSGMGSPGSWPCETPAPSAADAATPHEQSDAPPPPPPELAPELGEPAEWEALHSGLHWFGDGFDPSLPTVIYAHGWQVIAV